MTLFVDASALVAIIAGEPEREMLIDRAQRGGERLCSAMSCWETVASLRRSHPFAIREARQELEGAVALLAMRLVPIGDAELACALDAYETFGKGRHPARLNMGDCFAYACAKTNRARLLYKGDDFARTDLA